MVETKGTYHPSVPTLLTLIKAELGSKLPFCEKMYKQITGMDSIPYSNSKDDDCIYRDKVESIKREEVNKLLAQA
ncbi:hypothetical protein II906_10875 [bacterium]|nr:hypothetical protein [bacterium]